MGTIFKCFIFLFSHYEIEIGGYLYLPIVQCTIPDLQRGNSSFSWWSYREWIVKKKFVCDVAKVMIIQWKLKTRGVWHCGLAIYIKKSILRQKKNYGNSNISPCKNISIFKKSSKTNQNPSRYYNSIITNLKFQHKPKYHLLKILI